MPYQGSMMPLFDLDTRAATTLLGLSQQQHHGHLPFQAYAPQQLQLPITAFQRNALHYDPAAAAQTRTSLEPPVRSG